MDSSVMQCIEIRKDFFEKYYSVPEAVQPDVAAFVARMTELGEQASDAQDFEAKFAANGLQEQLNALLIRCTPKPYKMTAEEKASAKETAKEIFKEDRSRILKEEVEDAVDFASVTAEEELIVLKRRAMIEAGVYDDYTRATNVVEFAKDTGSLFKGLFKKKKK